MFLSAAGDRQQSETQLSVLSHPPYGDGAVRLRASVHGAGTGPDSLMRVFPPRGAGVPRPASPPTPGPRGGSPPHTVAALRTPTSAGSRVDSKRDCATSTPVTRRTTRVHAGHPRPPAGDTHVSVRNNRAETLAGGWADPYSVSAGGSLPSPGGADPVWRSAPPPTLAPNAPFTWSCPGGDDGQPSLARNRLPDTTRARAFRASPPRPAREAPGRDGCASCRSSLRAGES